jgi:hypothetical protein
MFIHIKLLTIEIIYRGLGSSAVTRFGVENGVEGYCFQGGIEFLGWWLKSVDMYRRLDVDDQSICTWLIV